MVKKVLLIVIVLLILGGCSDLLGTSDTSAGKIIPPTDTSSPFSGKWTVLEVLGTGDETESTVPQWTGRSVQFVEDCVALDDTIWANISYKNKEWIS